MSLASGTRLGPYEILGKLGAGGMGEVYRARDTRLGRAVAVKILPDSLAADRERLRWFEQEARAVAALNHANILSVHDVGEQRGIHYLVTELLEGTTLREELAKGPLPARRATEYAIHIARGLSAAHEKGVVHRDIKPENVFVTREGQVKLLDFGLARQVALEGGEASVTLTATHAATGALVGTIGYMAPEQITGGRLDHRADIFAFGIVLYEMLTGRRAFQRDSGVATSAAILDDDPPEMTAGGQPVPAGLQHIVLHCLRKDPAQRFQSARDLALALDSVRASSTQSLPAMRASLPHGRWRWAALGLAVLFAAAAVLAAGFALRPLPIPDYRQLTLDEGYIEDARFAPDGHSIVYSAGWDHRSEWPVKLYTIRDDGSQGRSLDLPPSNLYAVSRGGDLAIDQLASGHLSRVPLAGGAPRELATNAASADWSPDASRLAVARAQRGKSRLEFPLGRVLYETTGSISDVRVSPQGDAIAFMEHPIVTDDRGSVALVDMKGNKRTITREWGGEGGLAWSPDGSEIWFTATAGADTERALRAVTRSGRERLILRAPGGLCLQDIAADGRVLFKHDEKRWEVMGGRVGEPPRRLSWLQMMEVDAGGLSIDGRSVVLSDPSGTPPDYALYLVNLDGSPPVLLGNGIAGGISPDGKWVTSILPSDDTKLLLLPTGIGEVRTVAASGFHYLRAGWTSDGTALLIHANEPGRPRRVWLQDLAGNSRPRPVTPEGTVGRLVAMNHQDYVAARDGGGAWRLFPVRGGDPKPLSGVGENEVVVGASFTQDVVYVITTVPTLARELEKLDIVTGTRRPFLQFAPADRTGIVFAAAPIVSRNELSYAYTQGRVLSVLYLASGLR